MGSMMSSRSLILLVTTFSLVVSVAQAGNQANSVVNKSALDKEPSVSQDRNQILQHSTALEDQIEIRRQQSLSEQGVKSEQYKNGFNDGYNQAVIDLVKSQLLSESSSNALIIPITSTSQNQTNSEDVGASQEWLDQSFSYLVSQDWSKAITTSTQAITLNPESALGYINRSWAYAEKGLTQNAIEEANKALDIAPKNALAYNNRGYAYEIEGKKDLAIKDFRLACQLRYQAACETVQRIADYAVQKNLDDIKRLSKESLQKYKLQDWLAVEELNSKILKIDPENVSAYINRSVARSQLGQLKNALNDSLFALQLNPKLGMAHNNKGRIHEQLGQIGKAKGEYQMACQLGVQKSCIEYNRLNIATVSK